jgi:hypothetical protein
MLSCAAGGRGIIDALEKHMQLSRRQVEPSRAALYRFGNVSSTRWDYIMMQYNALGMAPFLQPTGRKNSETYLACNIMHWTISVDQM